MKESFTSFADIYPIKVGYMKQKTYNLEYFKNFAKSKGAECLSEIYEDRHEKLLFKCENGHEFKIQSRKVLEGIWCKECSRNRNRKYSIDENFFNKDTSESFYLAGFIAADGWVRANKHGYTLGIELSAKDLDHLTNINNLLKSNYPIRIFTKSNESLKNLSRNVKPISEMCGLRLTNREIVKGLARFGIVPAKTSFICMPEWLQNHEFVHHFLRGLFDGDGCFYESRDSIRFSLTGNVQMLKSVDSVINKNNILSNIFTRNEIKGTFGTCNLYTKLAYGGNNNISKLYDFLYKDYTICLERKRVIAEKSKYFIEQKIENRKIPRASNYFTKNQLLDKMSEFKDRKKVVEYFGCTNANISWWIKEFGLKQEINKILGVKTKHEIFEIYKQEGTYDKAAKIIGCTKQRVWQIVQELKYITK